ncbi:MAG TPA: hypothetical protein DEQ02_06020 [Ruminococcaceae bacterium]|nr:hypothetical protein [Oscillospiraceae bacterium]
MNNIDTLLALMGVIISLGSLILGIFGANAYMFVKKNKAQITNSHDSNIKQYSGENITVNEGIDEVKAAKITLEVVKKETQEIENKLKVIKETMREYEKGLSEVENRLAKIPKIIVSRTEPEVEEGAIWLKY